MMAVEVCAGRGRGRGRGGHEVPVPARGANEGGLILM